MSYENGMPTHLHVRWHIPPASTCEAAVEETKVDVERMRMQNESESAYARMVVLQRYVRQVLHVQKVFTIFSRLSSLCNTAHTVSHRMFQVLTRQTLHSEQVA